MLKEFQNQFILSSGTPFALPIILKPQEIPFCQEETELLGYTWTTQNSYRQSATYITRSK